MLKKIIIGGVFVLGAVGVFMGSNNFLLSSAISVGGQTSGHIRIIESLEEPTTVKDESGETWILVDANKPKGAIYCSVLEESCKDGETGKGNVIKKPPFLKILHAYTGVTSVVRGTEGRITFQTIDPVRTFERIGEKVIGYEVYTHVGYTIQEVPWGTCVPQSFCAPIPDVAGGNNGVQVLDDDIPEDPSLTISGPPRPPLYPPHTSYGFDGTVRPTPYFASPSILTI